MSTMRDCIAVAMTALVEGPWAGRPVKVVRRLDVGHADVTLLADMLPKTAEAS